MLGFGFDYPAVSFEYQLKAKTYVITREMSTKLTPAVIIYFDFDSAELRKNEIPKLKVFKKGDRVIISGYASPEGSEEYNLELSKRRAMSVKTYLEKQGVKVLKLKAFGESVCFEKQKDWWRCRKAEVIKNE